jgi:hypothetical protein
MFLHHGGASVSGGQQQVAKRKEIEPTKASVGEESVESSRCSVGRIAIVGARFVVAVADTARFLRAVAIPETSCNDKKCNEKLSLRLFQPESKECNGGTA